MTPAVRRHVAACLVGGGMAFAVFLWFLWAAPGGFLDETPYGLGGFFDEQVRAWFQGRWHAGEHSFFIERITVDGRYHMYFGPWPSVLRAPILAVTSSLDGRLTRVSLLIAVAVQLAGVGRLVWQVRSLRGGGVPSRSEQVAVAAFLLAVGCGTSVVLMSTSAWVYDEAILWGAAWAVWTLSLCISYLVAPAARTLALASAATTLAITSRVTSGVIGVAILGAIAAVQLAHWFVPSGTRATVRRRAGLAGFDHAVTDRRPWAAVLAAAVPLVAYSAVNVARFGSPLAAPFHLQDVVNELVPQRAAVLEANGSDLLAFDEIPTNIVNYFRPDGISLHRLFPFADFSEDVVMIGSPARDPEGLHASMTVTSTFLLVLSLVGLAAVFLPRVAASSRIDRARVLRVPALAAVVSVGPTLMFPAVSQRYTVDFAAAFVLLGAVGMYALATWLRARRATRSLVVAVGACLLAGNLAVNLALSLNLQRGYQDLSRPADRADWVWDRIRWTERLGIDPLVTVIRWDPAVTEMPPPGPLNSFLVVGRCTELMLSDGSRWLGLATDDPGALCDALAP